MDGIMQLTAPKRLESLDAVFSFLTDCQNHYKIDGDSVYALSIAVEEVFTNLIKYSPGKGVDVTINFELKESTISVQLIDYEAVNFDLTKLDTPDMEQLALNGSAGGRGIYLVKQLMDAVSYRYHEGTSEITLLLKVRKEYV